MNTNQIARVLDHAVRGLYADRLPAPNVSLELAAVRALAATVNGAPDAAELTAIFHHKLHEAGLSPNLVELLKGEGVL